MKGRRRTMDERAAHVRFKKALAAEAARINKACRQRLRAEKLAKEQSRAS